MSIEALTHRDDGTQVAVPQSQDDLQQWVSAGRTRNWMLHDPLVDWLRLYGEDRDYIPRQELDNYVEELDFLRFIFERAQEFEAGILRLLQRDHEVTQIAQDYRDITNLDRAEETFAAMQRGALIIYQAVLWDAQHLNYGSPDFLVRSDVLHELFPTAITAADAPVAAPDLGANDWHYRVVDTKFATLHLQLRRHAPRQRRQPPGLQGATLHLQPDAGPPPGLPAPGGLPVGPGLAERNGEKTPRAAAMPWPDWVPCHRKGPSPTMSRLPTRSKMLSPGSGSCALTDTSGSCCQSLPDASCTQT